MSDYRAFEIDRQGHVAKRHEFEAPNDEAAIEHARQYVDGHDIEVWQLGRRLALLKHTDGK